jgi:hypothetical protein
MSPFAGPEFWSDTLAFERKRGFESAERFLSSGCLKGTCFLIVDLQMPGVKGLELQSQLAAPGSRVPMILRRHRIPSPSDASPCCRISGKAF